MGTDRVRAMEKAHLIEAFRSHLTAQLQALSRSRQSAQSGTRVDGTHRPSNRGERAAVSSQGYLALGLGQRIQQLTSALSILKRIPDEPRDEVASGALVELGDGRLLLILPGGQGVKLDSERGPVTVLSPRSPLVVALAGYAAGDVVEVERGGEWIEVEIRTIW